MRIKSIKARQIINSQGFPTLEVQASTSRYTEISSVPIASSKSKYEFTDAYDNKLNRFHEETLDNIVSNIERVLSPELSGKNSMDQEEIDQLLLEIDGTLTRSKLGVNTLAAISQAIAKLGAKESDLPLFKYLRVLYDYTGNASPKLHSDYKIPKPVITLYKSSSHNLEEKLPLQELFIIPKSTFAYNKNLIHLFEEIHKSKLNLSKASTLEEFIKEADKAIKKFKHKVSFGLDMAASRYKSEDSDEYIIPNLKSSKVLWKGSEHKLAKVYLDWLKKYSLSLFEDPFAEDDYNAWHEFKNATTDTGIQIVSDDFTATNVERLDKVSLLECCNNVVVKPTQIGTVTESIHFAQRARKYNHNITVSYRNGETEDTFISDLAVSMNANFFRSGYKVGSEYLAKLNRLLQIEEEVRH